MSNFSCFNNDEKKDGSVSPNDSVVQFSEVDFSKKVVVAENKKFNDVLYNNVNPSSNFDNYAPYTSEVFLLKVRQVVEKEQIPANTKLRVKKNMEEGRGFRLMDATKKGRGGDFEFASSNELWRASLDVIDFMPLSSVNYSGGMIITDWYSENNNNSESLKITVRFLSNDIRADSLKVIVHRKNCNTINNCNISLLPENSRIKKELLSVILKKASLIKKGSDTKK